MRNLHHLNSFLGMASSDSSAQTDAPSERNHTGFSNASSSRFFPRVEAVNILTDRADKPAPHAPYRLWGRFHWLRYYAQIWVTCTYNARKLTSQRFSSLVVNTLTLLLCGSSWLINTRPTLLIRLMTFWMNYWQSKFWRMRLLPIISLVPTGWLPNWTLLSTHIFG